jgi:DNA-binding GntR family transcriptional regulator
MHHSAFPPNRFVQKGGRMPIPTHQPSQPGPRRLLRDTVAESIRSAIMDGTFRPGERLHDDELQQWLGVSRTPIRDALNELTRGGLVEMSPNRYTRVSNPDARSGSESIVTIAILLEGILRVAGPAMTEERRAEAHELLDDLIASLEGPATAVADVCLALVPVVVRWSGNAVLEGVCSEALWGLAFRIRAGYRPPTDITALRGLFIDLKSLICTTDPRYHLVAEAAAVGPGPDRFDRGPHVEAGRTSAVVRQRAHGIRR